MNFQEAAQTLEQAVRIGQARGAYSLEDTVMIMGALEVLAMQIKINEEQNAPKQAKIPEDKNK